MDEQELRQEKRARNIIWAAADNYTLSPLFLAFKPDGTADLYLNLIIGLTYKWYDPEKVDLFFGQLTGKNQELYEGLLWIGLENAVYKKEKKKRSALGLLRFEYAKENLERYRSYKDYAQIDRIRNGHCREICGEDSGLGKEDEAILHAFLFTEEMSTDDILEQTRQNLWKFFSYRPGKAVKQDGVYFLQKVVGAFHSVGKVSSDYVRAKSFEDASASGEGKQAEAERAKHYLLQFSARRDPKRTKQYVEACFGKSIYSALEQEQIEKKLCVGNHKYSHLLFTKGHTQGVSFEDAVMVENSTRHERCEIREFLEESSVQYEKNKRHFERNQAVYHNSIRKLSEKLRICLEEKEERESMQTTHGKINPANVWKAVYLDNPRVFERKEEEEIPGFSVDILMDASSSRKPLQEQIAAQAYVLEQALSQCRIPVQIYSYCSVRGFTVMRIFKGYDEKTQKDVLFQYVAAGNNRDGIALRAAGHLMEQSRMSKRILLVLTDASPQDDQNIGEGAFYKDKEYTDLIAVRDTVQEVQALKNKGVQVFGIFMGSANAGKTANRIFGHGLVKIRHISEFSDAVARVLQEALRNW